VVCELQRKINLNPVSIDRRIDAAADAACRTARRPDLLYVTLFQIVLVEIDEHQHADRDPACECARLSQIAGALASGYGVLPVVVIRYNPDRFSVGGGRGGGAAAVDRDDRLERLVSVVKRELNRPAPDDGDDETGTGYSFRLIQLYYDAPSVSGGGGGGGGGGAGGGVKFTDDGFEAEEDITRRVIDPCA
jgi:hypothetical protein